MHNFLQKFIPHILMLMVLFIAPPSIAVYIFAVFYTMGIFINFQKEKELAAAKNKPSAEWWQVLGTDASASIADCARVRKLLTKIYHPDGGQAPNEMAMIRINEAFEVRACQPDSPTGTLH